MTSEQIGQLIDKMGQEANEIKREALTLSWYMRGSLAYDDALHLSYDERTLINELVNSNLETTKKTGLPFF